MFPNSVQESGEYLENGEAILQVDTHPAAMHTIAAIQELHGIVKAKDQKIASLEERVAALETLVKKMIADR